MDDMPTSASQDSITVYAELLSNLRQLSVVASLPSLSDASTSASLADNGSVLKVCHQGKTQAIELAAIPQPASLQIPTQPSSELSWRLRLPPSDAPPERFALEDQAPPWSAREVVAGSPITCRACGEALVDKDRVIEWKDLPSDNWAEMMEFWHCHKPVDHTESEGANGEAATSKGYGASNVISAQQGVGLVDVTSFVLSKVDCTAVMFSISTSNLESDISKLEIEETGATRFLHASCKACTARVGVLNVSTDAVSLFKWQVMCETRIPGATPDVTECLAATLMATISRSGSAKCIIAPHMIGDAQSSTLSDLRSLYVWVLNSNVVYAASNSSKVRKGPAMKLLFRSLPVEEGNSIIDAMNSDVQELTLPRAAIEAVILALDASNHLLPGRERTFQDWKVGLLHRWVQPADSEI